MEAEMDGKNGVSLPSADVSSLWKVSIFSSVEKAWTSNSNGATESRILSQSLQWLVVEFSIVNEIKTSRGYSRWASQECVGMCRSSCDPICSATPMLGSSRWERSGDHHPR